jgi:hypothetical protein
MYHNIPPFPQKPKQCHGIHGVSRILSELRRRLRRLRLRLSLQALVRWMKNDSTCFNKFIEGKIYKKPYGFKIFTIKFIGFSDVFLQKKNIFSTSSNSMTNGTKLESILLLELRRTRLRLRLAVSGDVPSAQGLRLRIVHKWLMLNKRLYNECWWWIILFHIFSGY